MPTTSTAEFIVEDITEMAWEDLAMEMVDDAGPDIIVGPGTCVTSFTVTGFPTSI